VNGPVLLYDGTCAFCAEGVQVVLRHDRRKLLRFAPLEGEFGAAVRQRHRELAGLDTMVWVDPPHGSVPERIFVRSCAGLRLAAYLGGVWRAALLGWLLPRAVRDALYDFIARHRHGLSTTQPQCMVPHGDARDRFLA
jgi:predicted DCC family thiol-disulfide oxidoreductase YuxK